MTSKKPSTAKDYSLNSGKAPVEMRSHVIELRPNKKQGRYLAKCAGTMRFVYNSLVQKWKSGDKYSRRDFQKFCINLRQSTPWMREVSSRATYEAADNFHVAASNFFKSCKGDRLGRKMKPPTFKKKSKSIGLQFSHGLHFSVNGRHLKIGGLSEKIAMREFIRFTGTVKSVSIKLVSGKWFASFLVGLEGKRPEENNNAQEPRAGTVGIDLGLTFLAALSTGELVKNPKPLFASSRLLKRRQRQASKKLVKGPCQSKRYKIAAARVSRIHKKVKDKRSAFHHHFTTSIVKRFNKIVIEDLKVGNLLKNRSLSKAISDAGWWSIRNQLVYKSKHAGVELVIADQFFPSSKTCSCCGYKMDKMPLNDRTFNCPHCGLKLNRDINAARNLAAYVAPTPPISGSRKTSVLDLCKSSSQDGAGLPEGANIKPLKVCAETHICEHNALIY